MLDYDPLERAYRLAAPLLSLGQAMRAGSPILLVAGPLMRSIAEEFKINVGLAIRDRDEMVYLESVRYNRKVSLRNVVAGLRVPIALTSLGRRSEEHTSELQSLMRISYAVFCLKKKKQHHYT